jgi:hypothetical protein
MRSTVITRLMRSTVISPAAEESLMAENAELGKIPRIVAQ